MTTLTSYNISVMFLSLGILLFAARLLGETAQRFQQPAVLGELLSGILLGPTILGSLAPGLNSFLFPLHGMNAIVLETISTLGIVLFLLVAGMEVNLSTLWNHGKIGSKVGITSIIIPFSVAFAAAWIIPEALGRHTESDPLIFALFFAIAISISALPVIAKTLMDMGLYRSDLGMVVVSAAIFNDLIGWIFFALVLGLIGGASGSGSPILVTILLTLAFTGAMLTIGRWLIHKALPFVQAYTHWPGGELSFALILGLLGAAFTEWIGIHAIFGSFIAGVAIGDSSHLREHSRVIIDKFVSFIFAPIFFASIGLKISFIAHFDLPLVVIILLIACICKLAGGTIGALWGGMSSRESWAVGFAMNSRGAMEIILGIIAMEFGIIRDRLFVALVVMAIVTSMISGPAMKLILQTEKKKRLRDFLSSKLFIGKLKGASRREVIHEMSVLACEFEGLEIQHVDQAVWSREELISTGIGNRVALPHARIEGLRRSLVVVGVSKPGIDFNSPDGKLANVIFLILTPQSDTRTQLDIISDIAHLFRDQEMIDKVVHIKNFTDFLALACART